MLTSKINWRTISENDFNEIAESLIVRDRTGGGLVAQAVDGRGGDGGIDIDVRVEQTGQLTEILQLKWFPEGFSGGHSRRKEQILKSFESAMFHKPAVWTLVVPAKLTPRERKSVWTLRKDRRVLIRFVDATDLNLLLAKYPEVHDWATRDASLAALSLVGREQAMLTKPTDLSAEALRLHQRSEGVSAYWGRSWSVKDGAYFEELYAKRPDAAQREPLSFELATAFGPQDAELARSFQESLGYGVIEPLVLPGHVVTSFTRVGPAWFAGTELPAELQLLPSESSKQELKMSETTYDMGDRRLSSISGRTSYVTSGSEGGKLTCSFAGGLTQRWLFSLDLSKHCRLEMSFSPAGHAARDIQKAISFLRSLTGAARIALNVDGKESQLGVPELPELYEPSHAVQELVDDLAFIETHLNVSFEFPEELPAALERVWIRVVRIMLSGGCAVLPDANGFNVTLNGRPGIADSGLFDKGAALFIGNDEWTVNVLGEELFIGSMGIYHPNVGADDAAAHLNALRTGKAAGRRVHFRPNDDTPFRIYSPARTKPNDKVVAEPWGLDGIPEHAHFGQLSAISPN